MPIASDSTEPSEDSCVVVSLARPQCRREIHFDYERIGDWPEIVSASTTYDDGDIKGTLLKSWDRPLPPGLTADKTQTVYRIEGYRLYAISRLPQSGESLRTGVLPETNLTQSENAITFSELGTARMDA